MGNKFTDRFAGGELGVINPPESPWLNVNTLAGRVEYAANLRGLEIQYGIATYRRDPATHTLIVGEFEAKSDEFKLPLLPGEVLMTDGSVPAAVDLSAQASDVIDARAPELLDLIHPDWNAAHLGFGSRWGNVPAMLFAAKLEESGRRVLNYFRATDGQEWFNLPDWGSRKRSQKGIIIFE